MYIYIYILILFFCRLKQMQDCQPLGSSRRRQRWSAPSSEALRMSGFGFHGRAWCPQVPNRVPMPAVLCIFLPYLRKLAPVFSTFSTALVTSFDLGLHASRVPFVHWQCAPKDLQLLTEVGPRAPGGLPLANLPTIRGL